MESQKTLDTGYRPRVPQKLIHNAVKDNKDLCYDNPFTRNADYGKKLAEQCVREDESGN